MTIKDTTTTGYILAKRIAEIKKTEGFTAAQSMFQRETLNMARWEKLAIIRTITELESQ